MTDSPGELRSSQLITTFGPGAIVDLRDDSVLIFDLVDWRPDQQIHEPRLEKFLRVSGFYAPPVDNYNGDVPVTTFPKFKVCTSDKCGHLSLKTFEGNCTWCRSAVHPARIIVACGNGHLDDFPWVEWAHQESTICSTPQLKLLSKGKTATLADLQVQCIAKGCGTKPKNLAKALQEGALKDMLSNCRARRPWLRKDDESCSASPRALLRGASNVYFPSVASALSLPKWSSNVMNALNKHWATIGPLMDKPGKAALVKALIESSLEEEVEHYGIDAVMAAVEARKGLVVDSMQSILAEEWRAFLGDVGEARDFKTKLEVIPAAFEKYVSKVILCERLKEVRVLRGFTRIDGPDPEQPDQTLAPLSSKQDWLPAIEVIGEGIFLSFSEEAVSKWEQREDVQARCRLIQDAYQAMRKRRDLPEREDLSIILCH